MLNISFTRSIGIALLASAVVFMMGWVTRSSAIVHAIPGFVLVFNTALCFALAGLALIADSFNPRQRKRAQSMLGGIICVWAGAVLAQYVFDVDLNIDWPGLHNWLPDSNSHPGRMALMSCVAFILIGIELILKHHPGNMLQVMVVRGLNSGACLIGIMGVAGNALDLQFVFGNYLLSQVSLTTATGLIILTTTLWSQWRHEPWNMPFLFKSDVGQILLATGGTMAGIAAMCGLIAIGMMQRITEKSFGNSLARALDVRMTAFVQDIDSRTQAANELTYLPGILEALDSNSRGKTRALHAVLDPLLDSDFSAITIVGKDGAEIVRIGNPVIAPPVSLPLQTSYPAKLIWKDGLYLSATIPIVGHYQKLGTAIIEQTVPEIDMLMTDTAEIGETSELLICGPDKESAICVPTRQRSKPFVLPLQREGNLTPVGEALSGKSGVMKYIDLRNVQAIIAYTPIDDSGLSMSLRENILTLYAPLRGQLLLIIPAILILLAAGLAFLWSRVIPLARKLAASEERLRLAIEGSRLALWDWDLISGKIHLDEQWQLMLGGKPRPTLTTLPELRRMVHPDDLAEVRLRLLEVSEGRSEDYDVEHRVRKHDGEWLWIQSVGKVVQRHANGKAARFAGTNSNIQERKQAALLLTYQAQHDMLTELPNRTVFYDRLRQTMARSKRYKRLMAVLYLDIDKFKTINDRLGHSVGDALLKAFAGRLKECVRHSDTVARMGGDEFTVILDELGDRSQGRAIAQKIIESMRKVFELDNLKLNISTSVGIAFYDSNSAYSCEDNLIRSADKALYEAKGAGRDNYREAD